MKMKKDEMIRMLNESNFSYWNSNIEFVEKRIHSITLFKNLTISLDCDFQTSFLGELIGIIVNWIEEKYNGSNNFNINIKFE